MEDRAKNVDVRQVEIFDGTVYAAVGAARLDLDLGLGSVNDDGPMVGAGALLTRDVPDFALVYGSPAQVHGHVCRCGATLRFENGASAAACACGHRYTRDIGGVVSETA